MQPRVGLFVTCLVDLLRPSVGFAALKLLEESGCKVTVPRVQTCCGQPAFNSGRTSDAKDLAKSAIAAFEDCDYVVAPSGSCAAMLRLRYPELMAGDPDWEFRAADFAARCHELVSFLVDVRGVTSVETRFDATAAYHDSCSALRELGIREAPRRLLATVSGLRLREIGDEQCCGFGGTFCVKYPEIAARMARDKLNAAARCGAATVLSADLGCLIHLAGLAKREGVAISCRHVAEVLAGDVEAPAIAETA
jgi:L-lactate dehydrogenase complex protein LldE